MHFTFKNETPTLNKDNIKRFGNNFSTPKGPGSISSTSTNSEEEEKKYNPYGHIDPEREKYENEITKNKNVQHKEHLKRQMFEQKTMRDEEKRWQKESNFKTVNDNELDRYDSVKKAHEEARRYNMEEAMRKQAEKEKQRMNKTVESTGIVLEEPNYKEMYKQKFANHSDELKRQILEKDQKKWVDKKKDIDDLHRMKEDQKSKDIERIENEKKQMLRRELDAFNRKKEEENEKNKKEKALEKSEAYKAYLENERDQKAELLQLSYGDTIKEQMIVEKNKKDTEKNEEKMPAYQETCPHKCKMYACSICNRKYPKSYMSKR